MLGYTDDKEAIQKRLRRIEGQVRGLQRMVDEDKYCIEILDQIAAATKADARLLGVAPDSPVLCCRRTTFAADGRAVLHSEHVFPAHRTEFEVELTSVERSMTAAGLRLVD